MTLQQAMRRDEAEVQTSLSECLGDSGQWRARLNSLAFKGISEADLDRWYWILSAEDGDAKIERLVSTPGHKPIFVLYQILNRDESIVKGRSLMTVFDYIAQQYCQRKGKKHDQHLSWGATRRSLDNSLNMTPEHFCVLLRRLVHHVMRTWPSSIVTVARLVSTYIESISNDTLPKKTTGRSGYAARCFVFNYALQLFHQRPLTNALAQRQFNWKAQKTLLALSTRLKRPLVIDGQSFRAIRRVMIGLTKSDAERKVAGRLAKTWPPYREEWDGVDERRKLEDDWSMSVKAGNLRREAGYGDASVDHTLGVLGGAITDEAPSIQTRSLPPRTWQGRHAILNVFSDWAARVQATRNAHEAWHLFSNGPKGGFKPNFQVYAEMFEKIFAEEARSPNVLPGDNKLVFPVHDVNLSDFEKARLRPPSVDELYSRMLRDGNRPVGKCLALLIYHAPSLETALQYLQDSPLSRKAIADLTAPNRTESTYLKEIPLPVFSAYVSLLCRLQPATRLRFTLEGETSPRLYNCLSHAMRLAELRLSYNPHETRQFKAPWHNIMKALAKKNTVFNPILSQQENDAEALAIFLKIFAKMKKSSGLDAISFYYLNGVLRKALKWDDMSDTPGSGRAAEDSIAGVRYRHPNISQLVQHAHHELKEGFRELTSPVESEIVSEEDAEVPTFYHDVGAVHLHSYTRTLGMLGDVDEMIRVMEWMLNAWDQDGALEDAKDPSHKESEQMSHVFAFFRAFSEDQVPAEVVQRVKSKLEQLGEEKGCTWRWPDTKDVELYLGGDSQQGAQRFRASSSRLSLEGGKQRKDAWERCVL
ncbi:Prefoldin subunit [Pleurostoma richardsiae]|uniref:Prefoldin subunit n=1 Tax=Pleurostoma richardsiae TaxID=41990 RepID=A0AA38RHM3_9PEZI|nr:Prefoldin subunit [Pleurostoma richardsiae]